MDLTLLLETEKAVKTDNIKDTVNYDEVHKLAKEIVTSKEYVLIEALANEIAGKILDNFQVNEVLVSVSKPQAASKMGAKSVSVEVSRKK